MSQLQSEWDGLLQASGAWADGVLARRAANAEAARQDARVQRERFEEGVSGFEMADEAARQSAIRDALLNELRRVDPSNRLLNKDLRVAIGRAGVKEFVTMGRKSVTDADVVSAGKLRV
ncbi:MULTISPECIES: hypothetical protein [unclassified Burkholderia]|uniref:hypothetical protein n=1 Tax=unclassified Burkholderia TaxID=2613784 RepID=UPI002AAF9BA5|nr:MULTISPECIES: hypothetical protein [unclassified Burkholderia]